MKKFDLVFEEAMYMLREENPYELISSNTEFENNVRELAKAIKTFLPGFGSEPEQKTIERAVRQVISSDKGVKEMNLGSQLTKQIKIHLDEEGDSGTFNVTLVGKGVPKDAMGNNRKVISNNQHDEDLFDNVNQELIKLSLNSPDDAVEEMNPEEGGNAQPGGGESALPAGPEQAAAPAPEQPPQQ